MKRLMGVVIMALLIVSVSLAQETPQKKSDVKSSKTVTCAVCGMKLPIAKAGAKTTYKGQTYYFCSTAEKAKFQKNPEKYISTSKKDRLKPARVENESVEGHMRGMKGMAAKAAEFAVDPVCGMKVNPKSAKYKTNYKGKTYYFCAKDDLNTFKKNPSKYIK
ncbi:MAG: YHS domain-containing protein [Calditrichaeota bacterium]|nr:YHS domain-containing protein [Calditrichota bacterium]